MELVSRATTFAGRCAELSAQRDAENLIAAAFPRTEFDWLTEAGLLSAPLPRRLGGSGLNGVGGGLLPLLQVLKQVGWGSLPVGRIYEGHVNALALVELFGTELQQARAADDVHEAGRIFGVWNAEEEAAGVTLKLKDLGGGRYRFEGGKIFCSGLGHVTRPIVGARWEGGGWQMCLLPMEQIAARMDHRWWQPIGMEATVSGVLDLTGIELSADSLLGPPDVYYQEPWFNGGAIRFVAVHLGGAQALYDAARVYLQNGHRTDHPIQRSAGGGDGDADRVGRPLAARRCHDLRAPAGDAAGSRRLRGHGPVVGGSHRPGRDPYGRTHGRRAGSDASLPLRPPDPRSDHVPAPARARCRDGPHRSARPRPRRSGAPPLAQEPGGTRGLQFGRRFRSLIFTLMPPELSSGSLPPGYFDDVYRAKDDPWDFATSPYEAGKYAATLAALPLSRYERALEAGCSIGILTEKLASRCHHLLSLDVSPAALQQARTRCAALPQVTFERRYLPGEFPAGSFDLILVSEVGYYLSMPDLLALRAKCLNQLAPGGHLLLVHWTPYVPDYPLTGDQVHATFLEARGPGLRHLSGHREEKYRLDLFEKA